MRLISCAGYFELTQPSAAGTSPKADAGYAVLALRNLGCNTDTVVFVGDSEVDIQTQQTNPLDFGKLGFQGQGNPLRNGAVTLVSTAAELERVLNI